MSVLVSSRAGYLFVFELYPSSFELLSVHRRLLLVANRNIKARRHHPFVLFILSMDVKVKATASDAMDGALAASMSGP
jgi:hypothetical protein